MTGNARKFLRVGLTGLGAVGMPVVRRIDEGIPGLLLSAVSARDCDRAKHRVAAFRSAIPVIAPEDLAGAADIIANCAPASVEGPVAGRQSGAGCC